MTTAVSSAAAIVADVCRSNDDPIADITQSPPGYRVAGCGQVLSEEMCETGAFPVCGHRGQEQPVLHRSR